MLLLLTRCVLKCLYNVSFNRVEQYRKDKKRSAEYSKEMQSVVYYGIVQYSEVEGMEGVRLCVCVCACEWICMIHHTSYITHHTSCFIILLEITAHFVSCMTLF